MGVRSLARRSLLQAGMRWTAPTNNTWGTRPTGGEVRWVVPECECTCGGRAISYPLLLLGRLACIALHRGQGKVKRRGSHVAGSACRDTVSRCAAATACRHDTIPCTCSNTCMATLARKGLPVRVIK